MDVLCGSGVKQADRVLASVPGEVTVVAIDHGPWLDQNNDDDRILASFVEVMREHVRTGVLLVTRDINLQNKAEYAGLPFAEPPDPSPAAD